MYVCRVFVSDSEDNLDVEPELHMHSDFFLGSVLVLNPHHLYNVYFYSKLSVC